MHHTEKAVQVRVPVGILLKAGGYVTYSYSSKVCVLLQDS